MIVPCRIALIVLLVLGLCPFVGADEPNVNVTTVLDGLDNPTDVAVSPGGDVFVAESAAGRIVRVVGSQPEDVVTGFVVDAHTEGGRQYTVGPLSLAFVNEQALVVGGGGLPDGEELVRVYEVPSPGESIIAADAKVQYGPWKAGKSSATGEGDFAAVAVVADEGAKSTTIYVACNGDDTKGWLGRVRWKGKSDIEPFIATKVATGVGAPTAITLGSSSPQEYLVVAQMGETNGRPDSLLGFYDRRSGRLLLGIPTGLRDITGLAYSTRTPQLYAVDFASQDSSLGGLFRLDQVFSDGKQSIKAVMIAKLDKPTALAFAPDGSLFVTVMGTAKPGDTKKPGKLLRIESGL